jgi:predicted negative regulator of RcsB-dependent stress response
MAIDDDLNEAEQVERLFAWWRENWAWLLSGVALGVLIIIGWFYWTNRQTVGAEQAAQLYRQLVAASDRNEFGRMESLQEQLNQSHESTPYADQGRLLLARMFVETGEYDKAVTALKAVMDGSRDEELQAIAKLRLARVLIQQDKPDEALALLKPDAAGAFTGIEQDVRGDALVAKGDAEAARAAYAAALAATTALGAEDRELVELKLQNIETDAVTLEPARTQAAP